MARKNKMQTIKAHKAEIQVRNDMGVGPRIMMIESKSVGIFNVVVECTNGELRTINFNTAEMVKDFFGYDLPTKYCCSIPVSVSIDRVVEYDPAITHFHFLY